MNKLDAALGFHEAVLRVRGQRQELIAANIANADTPHYKARDIDFGAALKQALASAAPAALPTAQTAAAHFAGSPAAAGLPGGALFRPIIQGSVDGNTVDMDVERNQFSENAIRYEASLTMLSGQIKKLLAAIQGQ